MSVWIVTIADPLYYGPLYKRLIEACPDRIAGVVLLPDPAMSGLRRASAELTYRLGFWGFPTLARIAGRRLLASLTGRGDLAAAARRHHIPLHRSPTFDQALAVLKAGGAQRALATVPYRVKPPALAALADGWVNTHCGPLPRYGGVDAPFWCLYHNEPQLAVTLHYMSTAFDAGPLIDQRHIPNDGRPYFALVDDLFALAAQMHIDYLCKPGPSLTQARPQNSAERSYFGKPPTQAGRHFRRRGGRFT